MPRQPRNLRPDVFYHVLNRSAGRIALFRRAGDYAAFERIMIEAAEKFPLVEEEPVKHIYQAHVRRRDEKPLQSIGSPDPVHHSAFSISEGNG